MFLDNNPTAKMAVIMINMALRVSESAPKKPATKFGQNGSIYSSDTPSYTLPLSIAWLLNELITIGITEAIEIMIGNAKSTTRLNRFESFSFLTSSSVTKPTPRAAAKPYIRK